MRRASSTRTTADTHPGLRFKVELLRGEFKKLSKQVALLSAQVKELSRPKRKPERLRVREWLIVEDDSGEDLVRIGKLKGGAVGIQIAGAEGHGAIQLAIDADRDTSITLGTGGTGRQSIELYVTSNEKPEITLRGPRNQVHRDELHLASSTDGSSLTVNDYRGRRRLKLGTCKTGQPSLVLFDEEKAQEIKIGSTAEEDDPSVMVGTPGAERAVIRTEFGRRLARPVIEMWGGAGTLLGTIDPIVIAHLFGAEPSQATAPTTSPPGSAPSAPTGSQP